MTEIVKCDNSDCKASENIKRVCGGQLVVNNGNKRSHRQVCSRNSSAKFRAYFNPRNGKVKKVTSWQNL